MLGTVGDIVFGRLKATCASFGGLKSCMYIHIYVSFGGFLSHGVPQSSNSLDHFSIETHRYPHDLAA